MHVLVGFSIFWCCGLALAQEYSHIVGVLLPHLVLGSACTPCLITMTSNITITMTITTTITTMTIHMFTEDAEVSSSCITCDFFNNVDSRQVFVYWSCSSMAAPAKLRVLIMVLVWLLSGSGTRRCTDARRLPFENHRIRRRLNMNHFRPTVMDMVEQHGLQVDRWDEPYIHGVAELVVGFQYDHTRVLTDMDREQYWYWKSQGVPERDLGFFVYCSSMRCPSRCHRKNIFPSVSAGHSQP